MLRLPIFTPFNAAIDGGACDTTITPAAPRGALEPDGFVASVQTEVVSGGAAAAFAKAEWTRASDALSCEFGWEPTAAIELPRWAFSDAGQTERRSLYLVDREDYGQGRGDKFLMAGLPHLSCLEHAPVLQDDSNIEHISQRLETARQTSI